ncbi:MAG: DUF4340 domain-containing protein [Myxococcaceae bacterium]|nr:DUF4340 domain-containing protein [Myxococcaceae bacterium]
MSQARRSLLTLAVLTAGSLGLALFAWLGVKEPDKASAERKVVEQKLFATQGPGERAADGGEPVPARISRITVQAKGDTTTLERTEAGWRVAAPVQAKADAMAADALFSRLETGKLDEVVEEAPTDADLERYGLKTPRFSVTAVAPLAAGGDETVTLHGGIENPFNGAVYMRRVGDPRVYTAQGSVRVALEKSLFELREKEVLGFEEGKLTALEVKGKAHRYRLERGADKAWKVVQPRAFDADSAAVTSLLSSLRSARAEAFLVDSPGERQRLGFGRPAVDVVVTAAGGMQVRVRLAQLTEEGVTKTFALREEAGAVVLAQVGGAPIHALDTAEDGLRDRSVLRFEREAVAELVFSPGGGHEGFAVRRVRGADEGAAWQVVRPRPGPARTYKVSSLLWSLGALKASGFVEEAPKAWAKYGLSDGARSVALLDAGGKELARLVVGKGVPGKSDTVFARGSRDLVLELEASRLEELPSEVDELLEATPADAGNEASRGD